MSQAAMNVARRVMMAQTRRHAMAINSRLLSSVAAKAEPVAKQVGQETLRRHGQMAGRRMYCGGPARKFFKVGVVGLAGYGGYKLVTSPTTPSSTGQSVSAEVPSTTAAGSNASK